MTVTTRCILICAMLLAIVGGCDRIPVTGSRLTLVNYNQVTPGMTKSQVENILGPPTTVETKDMIIFKRTTYRYEQGAKFALFTFKNDELEDKQTNLTASP
jgi:outer membrane protein assembly factor BamE (lipoprotein component of BamABCDE complex)